MYYNLSSEIVAVIKEEVQIIKKQYEIVNPIIRSDIFNILERLCVVLRYPLDDDEEANGLHVERWIKGRKEDFVFINTSNSLEKQIYTAAHELGHVWKIDEKILEKIDFSVDPEAIINRFAAELLMPETIFLTFFLNKCKECHIQEGLVEDKDVVKAIVYLMNTFMVPYKAVVYRMEEIGFVDSENRKKLELIEKEKPQIINECIKSGNYQDLGQTHRQRSMGSLYDMLEEAEREELVSPVKISRIREKFGYSNLNSNTGEKEEIALQKIPEE